MRTLTIAVGNHGMTRALKDGRVQPEGLRFEFVQVDPIVAAMRQMVRALEFDVCEMAFATYLCALDYDKPIVALPVFLTRNFHHRAIVHRVDSAVRSPKDLEGRRVGVNRGYTVTTGVWARGILQAEYGVDLSAITWAPTDDEHVAEYEPPSNVDYSWRGKAIVDLLRTGEVSAAVGDIRTTEPGIAALIPDSSQAGFEYFRRTGIYPINHGLAIKRSIVEAAPWVAEELFRAFSAAKQVYLSELDAGHDLSPADEAIISVRSVIGRDPFPFGINANRLALETLIQFATDQGIARKRMPVDALFPAATHDLA